MGLTTTTILVCAILLLLAVHLTVTYLASERLNVFTSLCMLSMLPAFAVGSLAGTIALFATRNPMLAASIGVAGFTILVLPYTGQAIWELISGNSVPGARLHNQPATGQARAARPDGGTDLWP